MFGTVKLTKNANKSTFIYNGPGIAFDISNGFARNYVIFDVDSSSPVHTDNCNNNGLGEGPNDYTNNNADTVETEFGTNFTKAKTKFFESVHPKGDESYLHVNKTRDF